MQNLILVITFVSDWNLKWHRITGGNCWWNEFLAWPGCILTAWPAFDNLVSLSLYIQYAPKKTPTEWLVKQWCVACSCLEGLFISRTWKVTVWSGCVSLYGFCDTFCHNIGLCYWACNPWHRLSMLSRTGPCRTPPAFCVTWNNPDRGNSS